MSRQRFAAMRAQPMGGLRDTIGRLVPRRGHRRARTDRASFAHRATPFRRPPGGWARGRGGRVVDPRGARRRPPMPHHGAKAAFPRHQAGRRHADAGQPAGHRLLRPRGLPHRSRLPDNRARQGGGEPGRHRLLRPPRTEVGQGIDTAIGMLIAEEMDLPLEKVKVPLSDSGHELGFNMFTGGSTPSTPCTGPSAPRRGWRGVRCCRRRPGISATPATSSRPGRVRSRPRTADPCPTGSWPRRQPSRRRRPSRSSSKPNRPSPSSGNQPGGSTPWTS